MNEKLTFRAGVQAGKEFPVADEEITIGRELENNIVLDDIQVSRTHLRIFRKDDDLFVEDLKSTNGSMLNGKALKKIQKLKNGDMVTLGENNIFEVQFSVPEGAEEVKTAESTKSAKSPKRKILKVGKKREERSEDVEELLENAQEETKQPPVEEVKVQPQKERVKKPPITDKYPTWAIILLIAVGFILVFCVIPWVVIEATDQWCNLFAGFFNSISPGVCP